MNNPEYVELSSTAIFGLRHAVVEDPFRETMMELYGKIGQDSIKVNSVFNLKTAECEREVVCYGNQSAKARLDADEEASEASSRSSDGSKRIGQAHSHLYRMTGQKPGNRGPKKDWYWTFGTLSLSSEDAEDTGDVGFIKDLMDERQINEWIEIVMLHKGVKPVGIGTYFMLGNGKPKHPRIIIHNQKRKTSSMRYGFGLEIDFSAHYLKMEDGNIQVQELPLRFDPKFLEKYVTALPLQT